ncbi:MAG: hypothetical protein OXN94_18305 [Chloroflexota bacterium]|nr:hypothetical protein [Chloroflexota bacterium]MDE2859806.1 hypothetical protein [Chloroflexota bacterium]MDE2950861.1 hypothetical protein [Chloroflexota bacterium]
MKQNNWVRCYTPVVEYEVDSKGIRHIRTTIPGKKPKDASKPSKSEDKRKKSD